jgi:hypothetical protein
MLDASLHDANWQNAQWKNQSHVVERQAISGDLQNDVVGGSLLT